VPLRRAASRAWVEAFMNAIVVVTSLAGAAAVTAWRVRETTRPVTARKIIIPPLGMATGFSMFAVPQLRIPLTWTLCAFAIGVLVFSYPLIKSSKLIQHGDVVMLRRSPAFLWILLGLVVVRLAARNYVEQYVSPLQTGTLFFVLAFGMIVTWRVVMFLEYRKLRTLMAAAPPGGSALTS
jgi:membrane protein CcdC involved in cytochrome C biogenesis